MPREKDGFIYIMQDGKDRIKIGTTINIEQRYKTLRISNPTLEVYGKIPTRKYISFETFIHQKMKKYNVGGEWFAPQDEVIPILFDIVSKHGQEYGAYYIVTGNMRFK